MESDYVFLMEFKFMELVKFLMEFKISERMPGLGSGQKQNKKTKKQKKN